VLKDCLRFRQGCYGLWFYSFIIHIEIIHTYRRLVIIGRRAIGFIIHIERGLLRLDKETYPAFFIVFKFQC
jgi:hypothetical protein